MAYYVYTAHIQPLAPAPYETPVFVREGFNWTAFLFGGLWALYHRIWWAAALVIALGAGIGWGLRELQILPVSIAAIQLGVAAFVGFEGNDWLRSALRRRGYVTVDILTGESRLRAEQRFFERYLSSPAGEHAHA